MKIKTSLVWAVLATFFWVGTVQAQQSQHGNTKGHFSVSANGAATYSVPIKIPPGTNGMQPRISLVYNSQGGNGLVGKGWSIGGLSAITRCPATMAVDGNIGSVSYNQNDRFCLDGQRLINVGTSSTYFTPGDSYRTEIDSYKQAKAAGKCGSGPCYFTVTNQQGTVLTYGSTKPDQQILAIGKEEVRVWALTEVKNTNNNYYTITYTIDNTTTGQYYPQSITYTGNLKVDPQRSVTFNYESRMD
ncbi:MAG: hypothetical protein GY806_07005, partial [Gammaproteobacteria bacterium]|nr:hypothetical protein [Gammaproteobacteria bacterium]